MTTRLLAALTLALAFACTASPAMADKGGQAHGNPHQNGNGNGKSHGNPHAAAEEGWEHRGNYDYRAYAPGNVPPGWSHGKKTGWGNCGMPPGQAKKYGCRTYTYQGTPYYYYQDDGGQIFVRRPTIALHGSVDVVQ